MTRVLRCAVLLIGLGALGVDEVAAQTLRLSSVIFRSGRNPLSGDTYGIGETIWIETNFNTAVRLSSAVRLNVRIGSTNRAFSVQTKATFGSSWFFTYVVQAADADTDGITVVSMTGGTITAQSPGTVGRTIAGNQVDSANRKVDGSLGAVATGVALNSAPGGDTYDPGDVIQATVTFSRAVDASADSANRPVRLALRIGSNTRQAAYASGSGSASLVFRYTVTAQDTDTDGISIQANALGSFGSIVVSGQTQAVLRTLTAITNSANHKVSNTLTAAAVNGAWVSSGPSVGDTYRAGEVIEVAVTFTRAVDVVTTGGTPQVALSFDPTGLTAQTRQAAYASGSGGTQLSFTYTVAAGDWDPDGLSVGASALTLNNGAINDGRSASTAATLGLGTNAISDETNHKVDGGPVVSGFSLNAPAGGSDTYAANEQITATVTFNRAVAVTGTPQLALTVGSSTRQASYYAAGSSGAAVVFRYTVVSADADTDGVSVADGALTLNGGTINAADSGAAAGRALGALAISNDVNRKVDGSVTRAVVTGVALNSPPVGDTYERGDVIEATVTFGVAVDVTGTPQLALGIGSNTRQANYASGSGSTALVFRYTVVQADADTNGLSIGASALALNNGTIVASGSTTAATLGLGSSAISDSTNHKVSGATLTASAVSGVSLTSSPAGGGDTYEAGEQIEVTVTFTRAVDVVTTGGTPRVALSFDPPGLTGYNRHADYVSGTGTTSLVFRYTAAAGDWDPDGVTVGASALGLNSGAINDARSSSTAATLGLGTNAITNDANHKVDGGPVVSGLALAAPANGATYERGEWVTAIVTFNRGVAVTGTPQLALGIGTATRQASWAGPDTGPRWQRFRYTVVAADMDSDGVSIAEGALTLNGGTIRAADSGTDAGLTLGTRVITNDGTRLVDGSAFTAAAVLSTGGVSIASSPASGSTYGLGERIEVRVTFSQRVAVTGTPQLALTVGTTTRQADYATGSGTTALRFRYVVQGSGSGGGGTGGVDADTDGISLAANALTLNGGQINDARDASAAATLATSAVSNASGHQVNGATLTAPAVSGVTVESAPPAGGAYARRAEIRVRVRFDRAVTVTGAPTLALVIGSARREAALVSGSGTTDLVFSYAVQSGDTDPDGFSVPADALALNGGSIELAGSVGSGTRPSATLGLGTHALSNAAGHTVDGSRGGGGGGGGGGDAAENEPPAFVESAYAFNLAENTAGPLVLGTVRAADPDAGDVLTYTLTGGDRERFAVDAETGAVRYVGAGENAETGPGRWELAVTATDPEGRDAEVPVTVRLTNENEAPVFAVSEHAFALAGNTAGPLVLGTVRATDPDAGDVLTYTLTGGDRERFAVDAETGAVRYVGAGEDAETGPGVWELTVSATDAGGLTASASVTVRLTDASTDENEAPAFTQSAYAFELAEHRSGPRVLGRVEAADADAGDTRRYSLAAGDAKRFAVDAETGRVRYVGRGEDFESGRTKFALMVRVTDAGGLTAEADVTVRVRDVNEAPVFAQPAYAFELAENAAGPLALGGLEASDVDAGDELTFSVATGDAGRFAVDAQTGEARYAGGGEDYESGTTSFALVVRVTDAGGLTAEADVSVTVLDVNEAPEAVGVPEPLALEAYGAEAEADLGPHFRDPDGDALRWEAESSSASTARASVSSAGLLTVVPQAIGAAVVTVTASDPDGLSAVQEVQVTVEASRSARAEALKRSLAAFGRTVGTEAVEAVGGRLGVESSGALGRSHVQVGGRSLDCGALADGEECDLAALARSASGLLGAQLSMPADPLGAVGGGGASFDPIALLLGDDADGLGAGAGGFGSDASGLGAGAGGLGAGAGGLGGLGGVGGGGSFGGGGGSLPAGGPGVDGAAGTRDDGVAFNPVSGRGLLSQSSFQVSLGGAAEAEGAASSPSRAGWTLWGQAAAGEFEGGTAVGDGVALEGRTRSAWAGADYRFGAGPLVGLAVSHNRMESDFSSRVNGSGKVDARLTSFLPYLHWSPREGLGLWGMAGGGRGEAELEDTGGRFDAGLGMRMTALGVRQEVAGPLALKADAFAVRIRSDDVAEMAGVTASAQRLRVASELTGRWAVSEGAVVRARVELGARLDGGDAEDGLGAEAGGAVGFTHLRSGLSVEARGRTLLVHQAEDFREWGAGFAVRLQPGRERGGLSLALEPSWGRAAGGAGTLWNAPGGFGQQAYGRNLAYATDAPGLSPDGLAMEAGWGVVLPGGGEFTPFGRWSREGLDARRLNAGTRWTVQQRPVDGNLGWFSLPRGLRLMVDLFAEQYASATRPTETRFVLLGRAGF